MLIMVANTACFNTQDTIGVDIVEAVKRIVWKEARYVGKQFPIHSTRYLKNRT